MELERWAPVAATIALGMGTGRLLRASGRLSPGGGSVCAVAACAAGYVVTGGGISSGAYSNNNTVSEATIYSSAATGNSWQVCHIGTSAMTGTLTFTSQARCCRIQ